MEIEKLFSVQDKIFVVTGGNRGIGQMICTGLIENGARVFVVARNVEACRLVSQELNQLAPGKCIAIPADLSKESECIRVAKEVGEQCPNGIDVLINK